MDNRRFILLVSAIAVVVLVVYIFSRIASFMLSLFVVMKHPVGESRIMTHGSSIPGTYTVLAIRGLYDKLYQGVKVLAESRDKREQLSGHAMTLSPARMRLRSSVFLTG